MATRMQQRRGTAAQWTAANPILAAGEIGFETDTSRFKMGNGSSTWSALTYFANAAELTALLDGAPEALNTLNELAAAIGDDADFVGTVTSHTTATTNVHGIADTAALATTAGVNSAIALASATLSGELVTVANNLSAHNLETESVHGIEDTTVLVTQTQLSDAISSAAVNQSALAGNGLDWNADNEQFDVNGTIASVSYVDTAKQEAIDAAAEGATEKANEATQTAADALASHQSDTTAIHGIADTALLATMSYADQAEADAILAAGSAADTKVSEHNSDTTNVHGISDTTELETQTGAQAKADLAQGAAEDYADTAVSTAVGALTKSSVGLANVDNTSDENKPVSTAQASAIATAKSEAIADATAQVNAVIASAPAALNTLDELAAALGDDENFATTVTNNLAAKAPLANPTFTGTVTVAASGVAFTDGTQTKAGVPSITAFATEISSSATLASGEQDKFVPLTGAVTITLPASGYSTGQSIDFYQASGTGAQFASTNSVVGTPGLKLRTTNSVATAMKTSSGWLVFGDLSA